MIKLIIAVDRDNAIGWSDGSLPWKISADLKRFKELTSGLTVLMGRKTFESLNRPAGLPNRHNVVISRLVPPALGQEPTYFNDIDTFCQVHQAALGFEPVDLWIIGGAQIYQHAIEHVDVSEIYLTQVHINSGADIKLALDLYDVVAFCQEQKKHGVKWTLESREHHLDHEIPFSFLILKKHS